jgi:hypothetical protein
LVAWINSLLQIAVACARYLRDIAGMAGLASDTPGDRHTGVADRLEPLAGLTMRQGRNDGAWTICWPPFLREADHHLLAEDGWSSGPSCFHGHVVSLMALPAVCHSSFENGLLGR